ncbi:MAG TPA: 16S rRNA (adenine(1518)-N(6)/adenine(1519)-N(6))-dimethyltransferase, partial [Pseudomonadota bacterium]|nr:16S rRNA (adenine(1518)-N(6)/adenine(1519)-N(6))-dimethyltransferase [Pseudomonadota bacterium]
TEIPPHDRGRLERLVRHGFSQRRKTLRNALDEVATVAQMEAVGIDPGARAEAIAVADWMRLAAT